MPKGSVIMNKTGRECILYLCPLQYIRSNENELTVELVSGSPVTLILVVSYPYLIFSADLEDTYLRSNKSQTLSRLLQPMNQSWLYHSAQRRLQERSVFERCCSKWKCERRRCYLLCILTLASSSCGVQHRSLPSPPSSPCRLQQIP